MDVWWCLAQPASTVCANRQKRMESGVWSRGGCDEDAEPTRGILVVVCGAPSNSTSGGRDGGRINRSLVTQTSHSLLEQITQGLNRTLVTRTGHSLRINTPKRRLVFEGTRGRFPLVPLLTTRLKTIAFSPFTRSPSTVFRATGGFNHDCFCRDRRRQRVAPEIRGLVFCTGRVS